MTLFKQYKITLETLGPVHIGSGYVYSTKEYIYDDGKYYFPEMMEIYSKIEARGKSTIQAYERFLQDDGRGRRRRERLHDFLKRQNISHQNSGGYQIDDPLYNPRTKSSPQANAMNIHSAMKNAFGEPYIPGSSLKGAIRTILVNEVFKTDNNRNRPHAISWGAGTDDIFHQIRVSDSLPLSTKDLMLSRKTDFNRHKGRPPTDLPVFREAIKPGTTIELMITCEGDEAIHLIENLTKHSKKWYERYFNHFLKELPPRLLNHQADPILYLGGGTGFWTKTLIERADNSRLTRAMFGHRPNRTKMVKKGAYKYTSVGKAKNYSQAVEYIDSNKRWTLLEMGQCKFSIEEVMSYERT